MGNIDCYPWESEEQRKGYLALIQYIQTRGWNAPAIVDPIAAFFIQKDHEAQEWFVSLMADHLSRLEGEVAALREELSRLKKT